jgi:hypothetical protein
MAWIESHQTLRDHPKLMRLARLLDVPRTSAAGLLHFLWWWALDHAEDGDLSDFDALDLALAAGWEGDPDTFVKALEDCGPGERAGFLACSDGRRVLHDWHDYAGKLVDRRVKDRQRKRAQREKSDDSPKDVPRTSDGSPGVQNRTVPNPTEDQDQTASARKRATQLPDSWQPDDVTLRALKAKYPHLDLAEQLERFRDHAKTNGRTAKDWTAAWRNWVRKADEFARSRGSPSQPSIQDQWTGVEAVEL